MCMTHVMGFLLLTLLFSVASAACFDDGVVAFARLLPNCHMLIEFLHEDLAHL